MLAQWAFDVSMWSRDATQGQDASLENGDTCEKERNRTLVMGRVNLSRSNNTPRGMEGKRGVKSVPNWEWGV